MCETEKMCVEGASFCFGEEMRGIGEERTDGL